MQGFDPRSLAETASTAARRVTQPGAPSLQMPDGMILKPPPSPYVDAWTVGEAETGGLYAWAEIYYDADTGAWAALPDGRSGTADEAPAIERSASETVPDGTRIRLELDPSEEFYVFDAPPAAAAPTGFTWTRYRLAAAAVLAGRVGATDNWEILVATLAAGTYVLDAALHVETGFAGGGITSATAYLARCLQGQWGAAGSPGEAVTLVSDILNAEDADTCGAAERQAVNALGFGPGPGAYSAYGITEVYAGGTVTTPITSLTTGQLAVWLLTCTPTA